MSPATSNDAGALANFVPQPVAQFPTDLLQDSFGPHQSDLVVESVLRPHIEIPFVRHFATNRLTASSFARLCPPTIPARPLKDAQIGGLLVFGAGNGCPAPHSVRGLPQQLATAADLAGRAAPMSLL